MSIIEAVRPLIGSKTASVKLEVKANPAQEGEMVVTIHPVTGPVLDKASEEMKQLCAALAQPMKAFGTPETIEREVAAVVTNAQGYRGNWETRAAELDAAIHEAREKDAKSNSGKASTTSAKASATPAKAETGTAPEASASEGTTNDTANTSAATSDDFEL